jgi:hypothetical protein
MIKTKSNGKKNDPETLRAKAKELIELAEQIEKEKLIKIGKLTMNHYDKDFQAFDIKQFKKEIETAL